MIVKHSHQDMDPENDPCWNDLRNHDYSASFPAVAAFIHQNEPDRRSLGKRRNRVIWVLAVLLPLLVFFSCKRKTYVEPQGATLSFIAKDSVQSGLDFTLQQYAEKDWKSVLRSHAGTIHGTVYAPAGSYGKLKAFAEKLKSMPGVAEIFLSAVSTTLKESPLSRLGYHIFNRHVDATGASDEQLRAEIETKLKERGLHRLKLQLVRENGSRQVKLGPGGETGDFSFDVTLGDGTSITATAEKW